MKEKEGSYAYFRWFIKNGNGKRRKRFARITGAASYFEDRW